MPAYRGDNMNDPGLLVWWPITG